MKILINNSKTKEQTSFFTKCLCLYFMLMLCDIFTIAGAATLLKFYAIGLLVITVFYLRKASIILDRTFMLQIAYLLVCLCSVFYSIDAETSVSCFITLLMNTGLIILCQSIKFSEDEVEALKKSLVIGGVIVLLASLFFAEFSEGDRLTIKILDDAADQNFINGYLLFAFSYFAYNVINRSIGKIWNIIPLFLIFLFTFATGSRGALLSLFAVFCLLLFLKVKDNKKAIIKVLFLILAALFAFQTILSILPEEVAERFSLSYIEENGTTSRTQIWEALLTRFFDDNILSILFGKGLYASAVYNTYSDHVAHNAFIEVLIGTGVVGLTIYTSLVVSFFQKAWKSGNYIFFASFCGLMIMSMSLSLVTYKPIFNAFMIIEIAYRRHVAKNKAIPSKNGKEKI